MEFARWMFVLCGTGFWAAISYKVLALGTGWVIITAVLLGLALLGVSLVIAQPAAPPATREP